MKSATSRNLFAHCRYLCLLAAAIMMSFQTPLAQAQTFTLLHTFTGAANDGDYPQAAPVRDLNGNLYGVALGGSFGQGVVFKVTGTGQEAVLYSFKGYPNDGEVPDSISLSDSGTSLFGTTYEGGSTPYGTVFNLDTHGSETIVYSFCPNTPCVTGALPIGVLLGSNSDNYYGTTISGGDYSCNLTACGTVFEVDVKGRETVLHAFYGAGDGSMPNARLVRDESGNLYGATTYGGAYGYGTLFKVSPTGQERVIQSFSGTADGSEPYGGLYRDADGTFYGTTSQGGDYNYGTVFEVTPLGEHIVLHSFHGGADGAYPYAGVITDEQGNIFGTTNQGGSDNYGTVFELDVSRGLTVLHSFSGRKDGAYPYGVIRDASGTLYGTTYQGGAYNSGTVFEIVP